MPDSDRKEQNISPILLLRDVVVYPHMVLPLFVGRAKSIAALECAMADDKKIFLAAQKNPADDDPKAKDVYKIGTLANILQLLKLPDGTVKVLVEGLERAQFNDITEPDGTPCVDLVDFEETVPSANEADGLVRTIITMFEQYIKHNKKIPPEILSTLKSIEEPGRLADTIAAYLNIKLEQKQEILEQADVSTRAELIIALMDAEIDLLQVEKRVRGRVKRQMERSQREYYLNEQMKAIQKELGESGDTPNEIEELEKKIKKAHMPKEPLAKTESELSKLKQMPPMSSEAAVVRNFIDVMTSVPWKKRTKVDTDLAKAEDTLDEDHFGLEKVKERIVEYLAVQARVKKLKGPVLCLVGPPGVGKTSLGKSIAKATNREFVRMSLGGVRDEAEIRGHRRTYIGSMPGKIIQKMTKVGVKNPLFLLDEIDKMSNDFRGDPASAMLEVLDPEQNNTFNDHYLEVDYDLSEVMFVATANSYNTIPVPLLDRMEVINLAGYTEDEKVNIARKYLVPKQMENNGLEPKELHIRESAIKHVIRHYTREAGVRNLEREISKICRKVVKEILLKPRKTKMVVTDKQIEKFLGVIKYRFGIAEQNNRVGQVTGLAWTEVGGELLTIECATLPGKGKVVYTGQLGDVMQESITAATTVVRTRSDSLGINEDFHEKMDIHVHVPEGATPKDGPSAGIAMCTALVSALTDTPIRADVAMTGEITLRGEVLPIGGLKEKLLAARRGGIKNVIIPIDNEKDLKEIPHIITQDLTIHTVQWIDQVLSLALTHLPKPKVDLKSNEVNDDDDDKKIGKKGKKGSVRPHH